MPADECWEATAGLELFEISAERVAGRIPVRNAIKQPMGVVHGGVLAALAETLASWATAAAVRADGKVALGLANNTSFFRPITSGYVNAAGERRHGGRTTWVWDVDVSDDQGALAATSRVTVAVRELGDWRSAATR